MANRYWVGGTGNWSDDDNHWATESNGTPADGNLPTSSDDVIIDSNSGFGSGGTITINVVDTVGNVVCCKSFSVTTSHTLTLTGTYLRYLWIYGSITLGSGMTIYNLAIFVGASSGSQTATINGATLYNMTLGFGTENGTATYTLQDNLTIDNYGSFEVYGCTFDANDKNITANFIYFSNDPSDGWTSVVYMGNGTWTLDASHDEAELNISETEPMDLYCESSTISAITSSDANDWCMISTESPYTFHNLNITGDGAGPFWIYDSLTFNDIVIDSGCTLLCYGTGESLTTHSLTVNGSTNATLSAEPDTGTMTILSDVEVFRTNKLNIKDCAASGSTRWYAGPSSVDQGGNTGWIFNIGPFPTYLSS